MPKKTHCQLCGIAFLALSVILFLPIFLHSQTSQTINAPIPSVNADSSMSKKDIRKQVYNKILTDMFFRSQVAEKMIESGMIGSVIDLSGLHTYSEIKEAALLWIAANPERAADYAAQNMSSGGASQGGQGGAAMPSGTAKREVNINVTEKGVEGYGLFVAEDGSFTERKYKYHLTGNFLARIKALTAAASNNSSTPEEMVQTGRMMYDAAGAYNGETMTGQVPKKSGLFKSGGGSSDAVDLRGSSYGSKKSVYSGKYDDFKLNRAALEQESSSAEMLISALRGDGSGPKGAEQYYAYAWKAFGNFEGFVSPLKSRKVITSSESEKLEQLRSDLRRSLAGLSLRLMSIYAEEMGKAINDDSSSSATMQKSLASLIADLDKMLLEAGSVRDLNQLSRMLAAANAKFYAAYMAHSVYSNAQYIKNKAFNVSFSCLYDKLIFSFLEKTLPESPYVKARKDLENSVDSLKISAEKAASGDVNGALSGGIIENAQENLVAVNKFSLYNRKAQYYSWGLFFRPFEIAIFIVKGKVVFKPVFPWTAYRLEKAMERQSAAKQKQASNAEDDINMNGRDVFKDSSVKNI